MKELFLDKKPKTIPWTRIGRLVFATLPAPLELKISGVRSMFYRFFMFFTAPVFHEDEEKTRRARALNALQLNMSSAILILGAVGVLFFFAEKVVTSSILLAALLITVFGMQLNRRGMVNVAGMLMLGSFWVLTVIIVILSSGMQSLDIMFFISGTVVAGIILGGRGAYAYAGLNFC